MVVKSLIEKLDNGHKAPLQRRKHSHLARRSGGGLHCTALHLRASCIARADLFSWSLELGSCWLLVAGCRLPLAIYSPLCCVYSAPLSSAVRGLLCCLASLALGSWFDCADASGFPGTFARSRTLSRTPRQAAKPLPRLLVRLYRPLGLTEIHITKLGQIPPPQ